MSRLREKFDKEIALSLKQTFGYKSAMQIPRLEKIVLNMGVGDVKDNPKAVDNAANDMSII
ncbi:MAG: 50S ribosomal protein L5, partial [Saccharofermentanales bacterium]